MTLSAESIDTSDYWRINEIKNALYCPRISFYSLVMGLDRITGAAAVGIEAEEDVRRKMRRRRGALHTLVKGERRFSVPVVSHQRRLVGRLDEMVITEQGVYLVDYKDTDRDYDYWEIQMAAYRMCVEETSELPVLGCSIYTIPTHQYHTIVPSVRAIQKLEQTLQMLKTMAETQVCPSATSQAGKCRSCQYRRFCNDVL
jgi:CRISPR-associated exonuclease Cas4